MRNILIRQTPCFGLKEILGNGKTGIDIYPLNDPFTYLFFSARYAILAGLKALGVSSDQNILLPSYNCGTEIDPILDRQIKIKYYKVKPNLKIDLDDLSKQIDTSSAAILVIHYLGFPQPIEEIKKICINNRLLLIEDCAHAFLSTYKSENLGSFGDISVFSMRKTLPIPNGGSLVINNENLHFEDKQKRSSPLSTYFIAVELLNNRTHHKNQSLVDRLTVFFIKIIDYFNGIMKLMLRVFKKLFPYRGLALVHVNYYEFKKDISTWKISPLSLRIMRNLDYGHIKDIRRKNFTYLLSNLSNMSEIEVVFNKLPEGVCPLFFPLIVKDRQFYYQKLKEKGITSYQYWKYMHAAVPWEDFPESVFLKNNLLGLPIHQDIKQYHLDKILHVLKTS